MARLVVDELVSIIRFEKDDRAIGQVQQRLQSYKTTLNNVSRSMGIAGAALTGVGAVVGRTLLGFDRSMNALAATFLDQPVEAIDRLREQARELGRTTSKSATEAARAQIELARAGLSLEETYQAIPDVLNLAIAGELGMGEAAGLVTNQLAAFDLSTSETARVVDVLAATANNARTTVAELGPAFRQVAPLAANLGIEIEQVAAIIGTLRIGGLIPEQAGTAFRNIIAILQEDPTPRVRQGFRQLGLDFESIRAQVTAGDIEGAFARMGAAGLDTRTALAIFGRESATAAAILAGSAADVQDFTDQLEAAGGAADQMRRRMESGLTGSFAEFQSKVEDVQLELGESGLLRIINKLLQGLSGLATAFSDAPGPVKTFGAYVLAGGVILLGLGVVIRAVSWAISGYSVAITTATWLTKAWNNNNTIVSLRLKAIAVWNGITAGATWAYNSALNAVHLSTWRAIAASIVHRGITIAQTALTWAAVAAQWALNIAMTANPIGLIILAIVALIAILVGVGLAIWHFRDDIVNAFNAALNWAREHWPLLVAILLGPFGIIIWAVWKWRDQVIGAIKGVIDWVKSAIDKVKGFFGGGSVDVNINDNTRRATARTPSAQPGSPEPLLPGAQRGRVPTFHQGGIMGENGPAILQRGEMVLPPGLTAFLLGLPDLLTNLLPMMAAGPGALLPAVSAPAPIINNSVNNFYASMNRDAVTVQVTVGSTDAADIREAARLTAVEMRREIAAIVPAWFRDAMSDLASDSDTTILR